MLVLLNMVFSCKGILKLNVSSSGIPRQTTAAWVTGHADVYHSKKSVWETNIPYLHQDMVCHI